ncbi:MAG: hypothetical protein KC620_23935, partial [Myxococcales bacterium]|nr:hypothetical protein [Myxococcales bacterium]
MSRQIAGWTVALALIAVVWALAGLVFQAGDPFARLKAPEVRIETYWRATPEAPAHFRLLGGERTLKLVTHAILPPGDPAPPDRVVLFDVGLSLMTLDGQLLWRGIIRTSGRRSVDPAQRGEQPDAWLPDQPNRPVLDSRMLQFEIPMTIPPESRLLVEAVGVDALAVRLYARGQPEGDVVVRARELVFDDAEPLITDRLAPPQPFLRRPGEGAGIQVARTGNRRPFDENEAKVRTSLDPLRPLALNVIGPTQLTLSVWGDPDATGATEATGRVIIGDVPTEVPVEADVMPLDARGGGPFVQGFLALPVVERLRLSSA